MLLTAIACARIPTTDVPFLAHVYTSAPDVFCDSLLLWLQAKGSAFGMDLQINCVEYLLVGQTAFPSCIDREAYDF